MTVSQLRLLRLWFGVVCTLNNTTQVAELRMS